MLSLSRNSRNCASLGLIAFVTLLGSLSSQQSFAQENSSLTDEGLSQIVTDEVSDRLATYLNANSIQTVNTVVVEGKFHSLTNETLSRQLTNSLKGHEIVVDNASTTRLSGQILLSESEDVICILMLCTLSDIKGGEICTVRIRKVLPSSNRS